MTPGINTTAASPKTCGPRRFGLLQMLRIPGLGPKKAKALYDLLHIDTLEGLKAACETGRVAELKGFGEKTAVSISSPRAASRVRIDQALPTC